MCRERAGDENLGVRYLFGALRTAGIGAELVALNRAADIVGAAQRILDSGVALVGVSLSDNYVALDLLSFVEYLRRRGYEGHIVAGGSFATVQRHGLLENHLGLDSIVRLDGERALVQLAQQILAGQPVEGVAGVTTRAGDGLPATQGGAVCAGRPLRDTELPTALGVPTARMIASRGCPGQCAYCGSTAVRRTATNEAIRAGWSPEQIQRAGIAGRRVRPVDDFADELAELYHLKGARFFHLLDDNVLGSDESSALDWIATLQHEIKQRGVGKVAFSLMMEPSTVTDRVADALVDLGLIRTLVGVESLTAEGLDALGRKPGVNASLQAVERLHRRGVAVFFNSILLNPQSTSARIAAELSELALVPEVPFDALPLLVYPGTALYEQLQREDLLLGGMLGCEYRIVDPGASRFRIAWHQLMAAVPHWVSLATDAHEIATLLNLARRLDLAVEQAATLASACQDLARQINTFRVAGLRQLQAITETEASSDARRQAIDCFLQAVKPQANDLHQRLVRLRRSAEGERPSVPGKLHFFVKAAYAASLLVVNTACGGAVDEGQSSTSAGGQSTAAANTGGHSNGSSGGTTFAAATGGHSSGGSAGSTFATATGGSTSLGGTSSASTDTGSTSTYEELVTEANTMTGVAQGACGSTIFPFDGMCSYYYLVHVDADGKIVGLDLPSRDSLAADITLRDCVLKALSGQTYPSIPDGYSWGTHCVTLA